jgi:hypothetical protein
MKWLLTLWGAIDYNGTIIELFNAHLVAAGTLVLMVLLLFFMLGRKTKA